MGLFSKTKYVTPKGLEDEQMQQAEGYARELTDASPEEQEFLSRLEGRAEDADAGVMDEQARLRARGDDLANVDEEYMERAYRPAFERLMEGYKDMDSHVLEDMNRRGIMSQGSSADDGSGTAGSEPEAYQRMLVGRDTKNQLGRTTLEAQNQAVQQKLEQYKARMGETNQANVRYDQTMTPVMNAKVVSETDRMNARTGAAGNAYNARLGYSANMHNINSQRQMAGQDRMYSMIGAGLGAIGSMMSDVNVKTDIEDGQSPEEALTDVDRLAVQKWKYKMGGGEHEGAMAQDMPGDMVSDDNSGVDVVSYLGKLTGAVQALNKKVSAYDQLLAQGV